MKIRLTLSLLVSFCLFILPAFAGEMVEDFDSGSLSPGNGINLEGGLNDSFLRPKASFELCAECHQKDAPVKFKFFHDEKKRRFRSFEQQFFR